MELIAGALVGLAGLVTASVAWYRARPDKEATVVTTATEMAERLVTTAAAMVGPLEARLVAQAAYQTTESNLHAERIAVLELRVAESSELHKECLDRETRLAEELEKVKSLLGGRRDDDPENGGSDGNP